MEVFELLVMNKQLWSKSVNKDKMNSKYNLNDTTRIKSKTCAKTAN